MAFLPAFSAATCALALVFAAFPEAQAAKSGELTDLAGNYEGALVISGKSLSGDVPGTGKVQIKVSFKDGDNKGKIKSTIRVQTGAETRTLKFDYNVSVPANNVEYDYAFEGTAK